jgi:MFS family permease
VSARISQKVAVGVVFVAAMFMSIMDATIVNVALPTIGRDFGVSPTAVDAISIAFLAAAAICLCGMACSLSIRDADAAATIPGRPGPDAAQSAPAPSATA